MIDIHDPRNQAKRAVDYAAACAAERVYQNIMAQLEGIPESVRPAELDVVMENITTELAQLDTKIAALEVEEV